MSTPRRLPSWQAAAYAAPALPFAMLTAPSLTVIPALYMAWGGLSAQALALGLLLTRIAHAGALPFAGLLSDRYFNTPARRARLLFGATILSAIGWWQWLAIEEHGSAQTFIGWSLLLVLAGALFETNHPASAADIAGSDEARVRLLSARSIASVGGFFVCFALLEWRRGSDTISLAALQWLTWATILLLAVSAGLFALALQSAPAMPSSTRRENSSGRLASAIRLLGNADVRTLLSVNALQSLSSGMIASLIFTFLDRMLGIAWAVPQVFMVGAGVGIVASFACPALVRGSSCRAVVAGCAAISAAVSIALGMMPLVGGGRGAVMALFIVAAMAAPPAMIATSTLIARFVQPAGDPVEENQLATAYGVFAALDLVAAGIGAALAVHLLSEQGAEPPLGAFLAMIGGVPAICQICAALIAARRLPPETSIPMEPT